MLRSLSRGYRGSGLVRHLRTVNSELDIAENKKLERHRQTGSSSCQVNYLLLLTTDFTYSTPTNTKKQVGGTRLAPGSPGRRKVPRALPPTPPVCCRQYRLLLSTLQHKSQSSSEVRVCVNTNMRMTLQRTTNERNSTQKTDQRRCSTSIGAPPRFQKSPHLNPLTQDPNVGAPIPTQSAAEKSKDFSAHLADQDGGLSGRVPERHN